MATQWYYRNGGEERGPVPFRELIDLVRAGTVDEADLVRSSWKLDWQRADSVVGLFHMAGRSAEDLARLGAAPPPPEPGPVAAGSLAGSATPEIEELVERPGWMKRLFSLSGVRKSAPAEIPILGPPAVESAAQAAASDALDSPGSHSPIAALAPELAPCAPSATGSATDAWSSAVGEALDQIDQHAARRRPEAGRWGRLRGRISRFFAGVRRSAQSPWLRPALRIICALVGANLVAFAVENWSRQQSLRSERRSIVHERQIAAGIRVRPQAGPDRSRTATATSSPRRFPLVGECGRGKYLSLLFGLAVATGAAVYAGGWWLESFIAGCFRTRARGVA